VTGHQKGPFNGPDAAVLSCTAGSSVSLQKMKTIERVMIPAGDLSLPKKVNSMKKTALSFILVVLIAAVFIAGCTQQQPVQPTPQPTTVKPADTIKVSDSVLGKILVDAKGKTLYYFANDIPSRANSSCYGQCAVIWPVFSSDITVSPPLVPSDFSSFTRADGLKQTSFRGWPLYYYQQDPKPGDLNGENVLKVWFVVKPDETVMIAHQGTVGSFLTDKTGKTLYTFSQDTPGTSACTGACLTKWPAFNSAFVSAPSVLKPADFSAVTRSDGILQTAYMNRPLYYFADDTTPGEVKGQGFNNAWYVANVSGFVPVPTTVPTTLRTLSYSGGY
jgi:predicted lipoprotein with Yx(FWY)xxD motif